MYKSKYDCLALFSGGLDSILACKILQNQGLKVLGLHFISPFFGHPGEIDQWMSDFDLDILPLDIGQTMVDLLIKGPKFGFGKYLNPCIDCKILMLQQCKALLGHFQAQFIASGEVLGQRPMSQRRDALHIVQRQAEVKALLLRPLSAKLLPPTPIEEKGLVDRNKLFDISGRGRKRQLSLAKGFQLPKIPTPAGGCLLTEPESVKRFLPLFKYIQYPSLNDFQLSKIGRQFWSEDNWLVIGRNKTDNTNLLELVQTQDIVFKLTDIPGPLAIGRQLKPPWSQEMIRKAAQFIASFSTKARQSPKPIRIKVGRSQETIQELQINQICPNGKETWKEPRTEDYRITDNF